MSASRFFLLAGGTLCLLGVIFGAFGAHALKARLAHDMLNAWETAVQYHFLHGLALLVVGLLALHWPDNTTIRGSGWLLLTGIVLFSGSLYTLALLESRWLGAIAPLGGVVLIGGWAMLIYGVWRAAA